MDAWWEMLGRPVGCRLADIGCGPGLYARRFAELGAQVLAVDVRPEAIAHVPVTPNVTPLLHDLQVAPLAERVDVAVIADVLHHVPDAPALLANLRRSTERVLVAETALGHHGAPRLRPETLSTLLRGAGFDPSSPLDGGDGRFVVLAG